MGYLLLDGNFDEEKYEKGVQKLLLKENTEGIEENALNTGDHGEYSYLQRIGGDWMDIPDGWEEIELDAGILSDLTINHPMLEEMKQEEKKLIGKMYKSHINF